MTHYSISQHPTPASKQRHIILGAWTEGFFDPSSKMLHPEKLTAFEEMIHKKLAIAHYYIGWEALSNPYQHGWQPMLNVNPYYFSQCPAIKEPLYKAIADGQCDSFLHQAGKNLSQVRRPFYLLFAWEMNNSQNAWSVQQSGSSPADFVAAWRHIHDIFQQENARQIVWVFCPNIPNDATVPYNIIYPGSSYVDWIGLDGYNWGTTQSWSQWESFSDIFRGSYQDMTQIAPNKPILIAEVNTTDQGGDKGTWYEDMLEKQIPFNFPKVKAVVIFNEDRSQQEHVNWQVNINDSSLKAFVRAIHSTYY